jgi:hypothetical protein
MKIKKRQQDENIESNEYSRPTKKLKKEEEEEEEKGFLFKYPLNILEEELFKNQLQEEQNTFLSKDHKIWIKIINLPELVESSDYLKFIDNLKRSISNSSSTSCSSSSSSNMLSYNELLNFNNSKKKSNSERLRRIPNIKYNIDNYKEIRDTLFYDIYLIERMSLYIQKYDIHFRHFILTENKDDYINSKGLYSNLIKHKEHNDMTFILSYGARRCLKIKPIKKNDDNYFSVDYYIGHYDIIILSPGFHKTHILTTNGKKSGISNTIDDNMNIFGETSFYMSFV